MLLHAVVDALLGAAALGDIGTYFPSSDARWRGASSTDFLAHTVALLAGGGWRIENVDATVVMETPRLGPQSRRSGRRWRHTQCPVDASCEGQDHRAAWIHGRAEGVACYAVALISRPDTEN